MIRRSYLISVLGIFVATATGDDLIHRYEGNVLPDDPSAGWFVSDPCLPPCTQRLENGHFVFEWPDPGSISSYTKIIAADPDEPPPTLWAEWRFRSNHPAGPSVLDCDGGFSVQYREIATVVYMYGDAAFLWPQGVIRNLVLQDFHTFRFENSSGSAYRVSVDGIVVAEGLGGLGQGVVHALRLFGQGGCNGNSIPNQKHEWDFVRYGTVSFGEQIIASDPPAGTIDFAAYGVVDRFVVTFDAANYAYINDITVETTGNEPPIVIKTRRLDNDEPDTVEIVLDRPLPANETTTFTFTDGTATNVVAYTFIRPDSDGDGFFDDEDNCPDHANPNQEDCDGDGVGDVCTLADCPGLPACGDCDGNLIPDICDPDCQPNGTPDTCDIIVGSSLDCQPNTIPDECDLVSGTSVDCDLDTVPDDCQPDADGDGLIDPCDVCPTVLSIPRLYWTEIYSDKIRRVNIDGSGVEDLVTTAPVGLTGIAIDAAAGKIYWTTSGPGGKILRANRDGSGVEELVTTGLVSPDGIALDIPSGKMYWADAATEKIQRANLDGTAVETLVQATLPLGLALDLIARKMYWTEQIIFNGRIRRANMDGTGVESVIAGGLGRQASGIALDLSKGKMYWTTVPLGVSDPAPTIARSALNGTGIEILISSTNLLRPWEFEPWGIALDPAAGRMYWTDRFDNYIRSANLDGSDVQDIIAVGLGSPAAIALEGSGADCQPNGVPDACDLEAGTTSDCNGNRIPDECDLSTGSSSDCDTNSVPDDCQPDTDGDGVIDVCDTCPEELVNDQDGDGVCFPEDQCPTDPDKTDPGACGCGVSDVDSDLDTVPDCIDQCPNDPNKTMPGQCGCGVSDDDTDGDTIPDCIDQCPGKDDLVGNDGNNIPDCLEEIIIPTLSPWGLLVLSVALFLAGRRYFRRQVE